MIESMWNPNNLLNICMCFSSLFSVGVYFSAFFPFRLSIFPFWESRRHTPFGLFTVAFRYLPFLGVVTTYAIQPFCRFV